MLTLDRHIWLRVIKGYALVIAILLSIFSLIAFVNELDMVGRGTYGIADAALNVLLTAPGRMVELAPATALMGSIIGLGELAAGHELIAMLALGISVSNCIRTRRRRKSSSRTSKLASSNGSLRLRSSKQKWPRYSGRKRSLPAMPS